MRHLQKCHFRSEFFKNNKVEYLLLLKILVIKFKKKYEEETIQNFENLKLNIFEKKKKTFLNDCLRFCVESTAYHAWTAQVCAVRYMPYNRLQDCAFLIGGANIFRTFIVSVALAFKNSILIFKYQKCAFCSNNKYTRTSHILFGIEV